MIEYKILATRGEEKQKLLLASQKHATLCSSLNEKVQSCLSQCKTNQGIENQFKRSLRVFSSARRNVVLVKVKYPKWDFDCSKWRRTPGSSRLIFETWVGGELQAFVKWQCIQISSYAMTKTNEYRFTVDMPWYISVLGENRRRFVSSWASEICSSAVCVFSHCTKL